MFQLYRIQTLLQYTISPPSPSSINFRNLSINKGTLSLLVSSESMLKNNELKLKIKLKFN